MLCSSVRGKEMGSKKSEGKTDYDVDMNDIAECIDLLDRCFSYIHSLGLRSHPGHLLGNVTIGVSRVLVGLGKQRILSN